MKYTFAKIDSTVIYSFSKGLDRFTSDSGSMQNERFSKELYQRILINFPTHDQQGAENLDLKITCCSESITSSSAEVPYLISDGTYIYY